MSRSPNVTFLLVAAAVVVVSTMASSALTQQKVAAQQEVALETGGLTQWQINTVKAVFSSMDKDTSGGITKEELGAALRGKGGSPTDTYLQKLFNGVDVDGNDEINLQESITAELKRTEMEEEVAGLTEQEVDHVQKVFAPFHDGFITREEMEDALRSKGFKPTSDELNKIIENADLNGDGAVSLKEAFRKVREAKEERLCLAFIAMDKDRNRFVTADEMKPVYLASQGKALTDEKADMMVNERDTDGDGKVNFEEFFAKESQW